LKQRTFIKEGVAEKRLRTTGLHGDTAKIEHTKFISKFLILIPFP